MRTKASPIKTLLFLTGLVMTGLLLLSIAQEWRRRYEIRKEILRLEQEIRKYERRIEDLRNSIAYYETLSFQERQAREKLQYQKPGEEVVIIPENTREPAEKIYPQTSREKSLLPNWRRWWLLFFAPHPQKFQR
jgi:cell division protein FtsB